VGGVEFVTGVGGGKNGYINFCGFFPPPPM